MKHNLYILFLLLVAANTSVAQKKKNLQVLVYGSGILAFSAAVQSAQSSVPTVWVVDSEALVPQFSERAVEVENADGTDGGIWLDLLMDMALSKTRSDSLADVVKHDMSPRLFQNAMERIINKQQYLQIIRGRSIENLKKGKKNWQVTLNDKQKLDVMCLVDASDDQPLWALSGLTGELQATAPLSAKDLSLVQQRTLVASGGADSIYAVQLKHLLAGQMENLFTLRGVQGIFGDRLEDAPLRSSVGQALGACAAYLAFFKQTADKIDVRKVQMELLTYGARILPYQDVKIEDNNFLAVQKTGLAGILQGENNGSQYRLGKDAKVRFDEIEPIFDQLYSRSQLWFLDNKGEFLRWKDFLSLIKFVGLRGDEVERQMEKDWSTKLKFDGAYDPEGLVQRYEFMVVLDRYATPFVKAVNQQGQFVQ
ncbi:hypothetical protein BC792_12530 [Sphingobacterium allocomposti]|uniref:FAD dependent oxidoreductase n=1 Tax=Sphingobacterium allocomposti TaxID=415956 RepID=A0A5S5D2A2_9SPHI|nr:hypothetical protein [Sphingobacterium composti Yoo et al. 2007 non Ten et al. 2007]TYP90153.1 hypothetical protein BC792_12530 [Sphingobacterium composti Yoo et al. 2007 non Ten et al. 2007]